MDIKTLLVLLTGLGHDTKITVEGKQAAMIEYKPVNGEYVLNFCYDYDEERRLENGNV